MREDIEGMTSIGVFQIKTLQQDSRDRFQSSYTVLLSFLNFNLFASHSKTSGFADSELSKRPTRFASLPFRTDHSAPSLSEALCFVCINHNLPCSGLAPVNCVGPPCTSSLLQLLEVPRGSV